MNAHLLARQLLTYPEDADVRIDACGTDEGGSWPIYEVVAIEGNNGPVGALLVIGMP